ncbi:hypothetical protein B0H14DRAFT_3470711 [Mycena olivaceomarginata]|nr:hypothetical protein B0H14DRAFT_3470711 [Mycena olivaceomarginata]
MVTGLLSPDTHFKKPEDMLVPSSHRDATFPSVIPGKGLPDPLRGMASPERFAYDAIYAGESASQAQAGTGLRRQPPKSSFTPVMEAMEEAFHDAYILGSGMRDRDQVETWDIALLLVSWDETLGSAKELEQEATTYSKHFAKSPHISVTGFCKSPH